MHSASIIGATAQQPRYFSQAFVNLGVDSVKATLELVEQFNGSEILL